MPLPLETGLVSVNTSLENHPLAGETSNCYEGTGDCGRRAGKRSSKPPGKAQFGSYLDIYVSAGKIIAKQFEGKGEQGQSARRLFDFSQGNDFDANR